MANLVKDSLSTASPKYVYDLNDSVVDKISKIATTAYGAKGVILSDLAQEKLKFYEQNFDLNIPICIAKTPNSLTGNGKILGRPTDFTIEVTDLLIQTGSRFLIVYVGGVLTMPGLPKTPNASRIDIDENEIISNLS